jgi:hypothetical protein
VAGDAKGLLGLKALLLDSGFRYIGWSCRKGSPAYAWARYWQAYIKDVGDKYPDGETAWQMTLDLQQTRRLRKNMGSVALVAVEPVKG